MLLIMESSKVCNVWQCIVIDTYLPANIDVSLITPKEWPIHRLIQLLNGNNKKTKDIDQWDDLEELIYVGKLDYDKNNDIPECIHISRTLVFYN